MLQRLRDHFLYVKPTKCEWMHTSIEFLGHMVSQHGLSMHPDKAEALQSWPVPRDVHDLRSLLGTFGFWRPYIPHFAMITAPLSQLLKHGIVWRWREEIEQAALDALKKWVLTAPVLMHPDVKNPFVVVTDAFDYGIGASLEQSDHYGYDALLLSSLTNRVMLNESTLFMNESCLLSFKLCASGDTFYLDQSLALCAKLVIVRCSISSPSLTCLRDR